MVTFEEMYYEHLSRLAAEVAHYVQEYEQQTTNLMCEVAAPSLTWGCRKEGPVLEKFLNNQVSKVDRGIESESDVVHKMNELQGLEAEQPKLLLWQHEVAVKRRDYLAAMDTLLRYLSFVSALQFFRLMLAAYGNTQVMYGFALIN